MEEEIVEKVVSKMRQTPAGSKIGMSMLRLDDENEYQAPTSEEMTPRRKRRRVRRKKREESIPMESFEIPGVVKLIFSPLVQSILRCVVGENVTTENPWKHIPKEIFEDNLELHEGSSEFLPIKQELMDLDDKNVLVGLCTDISSEFDEFYVCLTKVAEIKVLEIIEINRQRQEERVNNMIMRTSKPWRSYGSNLEVDLFEIKNTRPLLEVEVETDYPIMHQKCLFRYRFVENAIDGYRELLAGRSVYINLYRRQIDAGVQVAPSVTSTDCQTVCTFPINANTQYEYEYTTIETPTKEFRESMRSYISSELNKFIDDIRVNSAINLYTNDYLDLVKNEKFTRVPDMRYLKEYTFFKEEKLCKGKEVASVSWHPMWTGTVAIAYLEEGATSYTTFNPNKDDVIDAIYNVTPVLIWSLKDILMPRLYLETPRDINVLSFCPHNENILVGGCINGQIVIWDIKDKLQNVEEEEILTPARKRYRELLNALVKWMKNTKDPTVVRPTVVSSLAYSHTSSVTSIKWFSPFREMSPSGLISEINEEEERTSTQFMTAAKDGTILTWDLQAKPNKSADIQRTRRKKSVRLQTLPAALTENVSPIRSLHRVFKPTFKINLFSPNTTRNLPVSSLSIRFTQPQYVEKYPDPKRKFDIANRIMYKPAFNRPTHPILSGLIAGTEEGDYVLLTWEGFDFDSGEVVNKESAKIKTIAKYHDGPILSLARSDLFIDICLTVGGKVFALWKTDFKDKPLMWRRSKHRYTHGVWNSYRPCVFRLARSDGSFELWHLRMRSDRYHDVVPITGTSLSGTYTHPISMTQNLMGVGDCNGLMRLFFVARNLVFQNDQDKRFMTEFYRREADRKTKLVKWQEDWIKKNANIIIAKKEEQLLIQQQREEQIKREKELLQEQKESLQKQEADRLLIQSEPKPGNYAEAARQKLKKREYERFNKTLLSKLSLDFNVLEKQQLPLKEIAEAEVQLNNKLVERRHKATKIFQDTVAMLFPNAVEKKIQPPPDPYAGGDPLDVKMNLFEKYSELVDSTQEFVNRHEYLTHFDWQTIINKGKERRRMIDGFYNKYNHRNRIIRQKKMPGGISTTPMREPSIVSEEDANEADVDYTDV